MAKKMTKGQRKIRSVMREFKSGSLHSGKSRRVVKSRKQALAIALNSARRVSRRGRRR